MELAGSGHQTDSGAGANRFKSESHNMYRRLDQHMLSEVNECSTDREDRDEVLRQTTPRRTTRIRGNVAVGNWIINKGDNEDKRTREKFGFLSSDFEQDILVDTGCGYTIVSLSWLTKYCAKHNTRIENTIIKYPDGYEPHANTAAVGATVQGVGFARIQLSVVTLQDCKQLEWNQDGLSKGGGATTVDLDIYAHVFKNVGSSFLLGMPFIQRFINSIDFGESRLRLKG